MKHVLFVALALTGCAALGISSVSDAERVATEAKETLECQVNVVRPFVSDAAEARRFVVNALDGKVALEDAAAALRTLRLKAAEVEKAAEALVDCAEFE